MADSNQELEVINGQLDELEHLHQISKLEGRMDDRTLREIQSFDDAVRLATERYGGVVDISEEIGNGFALLNRDDKLRLVGTPFIILDGSVNRGDFGFFCSLVIMTKSGDKYIVNDGSTGLARQVFEIAAARKQFGGFMVPHGLRVSEYATCNQCDRPMPEDQKECEWCGFAGKQRHKAHTFYLDSSAA